MTGSINHGYPVIHRRQTILGCNESRVIEYGGTSSLRHLNYHLHFPFPDKSSLWESWLTRAQVLMCRPLGDKPTRSDKDGMSVWTSIRIPSHSSKRGGKKDFQTWKTETKTFVSKSPTRPETKVISEIHNEAGYRRRDRPRGYRTHQTEPKSARDQLSCGTGTATSAARC